MKTNDKLIIIGLFVILVVSIINFYLSFLSYVNFKVMILLSLLFIYLLLTLGIKKSKSPFIKDTMEIIFIYSFLYLIFTYSLGLILGYNKTPYSIKITKIIKNIYPLILFIIINNLNKYMIISRTKKKIIRILLVIVFSLLEISIKIKLYDISDAMGIFEVIGLLIIPSVINNYLSLVIISYSGALPSILYAVIFECYLYFVPIVPDLGDYLSSLFKIIFPTILLVRLNNIYIKKKKIVKKKQKLISFLTLTPLLGILILLIALTSNLFNYYILAIGSDSMKYTISKGDAVILKKVKENNMNIIKKGDILVFNHIDKTIVHRVIEVKNKSGEYFYRTKGDNNISEDGYDIASDEVIGIVLIKIPYIGYPTVWLGEKINI